MISRLAVLALLFPLVAPAEAEGKPGDLRLGAGLGYVVPYHFFKGGTELVGGLEYAAFENATVGTAVRYAELRDSFSDRQTTTIEASIFLRLLGRSGHSWHPSLTLGPSAFVTGPSGTVSGTDGSPSTPHRVRVGGRVGLGFLRTSDAMSNWDPSSSTPGRPDTVATRCLASEGVSTC